MSYKRDLIRPFGPTIAKVEMPIELIEKLNDYVDQVINNVSKIEKLDHGKKLAGNVQQEFKLEENFINDSGWKSFLKENAIAWINASTGETFQTGKSLNQNGKLQLVHGTKMFLSPSTFTITSKIGEFYFFPNYLMHSVYPFINSKEERRSISFNAYIDEKSYNVYGN